MPHFNKNPTYTCKKMKENRAIECSGTLFAFNNTTIPLNLKKTVLFPYPIKNIISFEYYYLYKGYLHEKN